MANSGLFRDDNGTPLTVPAGMRPAFGAAGIVVGSTGAGTAEIDIAALHTASAGQSNGARLLVRVAVVGSNPALVAFGAAGAGASFTSNDNMLLMPANTVEFFSVASSDVSCYHQQVTGSSTIQVAAVG